MQQSNNVLINNIEHRLTILDFNSVFVKLRFSDPEFSIHFSIEYFLLNIECFLQITVLGLRITDSYPFTAP